VNRRMLFGGMVAALVAKASSVFASSGPGQTESEPPEWADRRAAAMAYIGRYMAKARTVDCCIARGKRETTMVESEIRTWDLTDGVTITVRINGGASTQRHGTLETYQHILEQERRGLREPLSPSVRRVLEDRVSMLQALDEQDVEAVQALTDTAQYHQSLPEVLTVDIDAESLRRMCDAGFPTYLRVHGPPAVGV
jgi:hypothetical protein